MEILLTINNGYAPQAAACIASVCANNKAIKQISFFIITDSLESANEAKLKSVASKFKRSLSVIPIGDIYDYFDRDFDTAGWNEIILARILMARFLPSSVNRILYLDGDTIVRGSLQELWDTELGDNYVGGVIEPTTSRKRREQLGIGSYIYINSGVLLVDLSKWRADRAEDKILSFIMTHKETIVAGDQDALNGALWDRILPLSPKYNYCNTFYFYPYKTIARLVKPAEYYSEKRYQEEVSEPVIIHFLGEERPWREGNTHRFSSEYEYYLSLTPYAGTPKEQGWHLYFKCWSIFNTLTRPFPALRYKIISGLIPLFLSFRAHKRKHGES